MSASRLLARAALLPILALGPLVAACDDVAEGPRVAEACVPDPAGARLTSADVLAPGPFAVGTTSITFVDDSRTTPAHGSNPELATRTLATRLWYPAEADGEDALVANSGPFPLVVYSHGFSSFNTEGEHLALHLASRGYVVAAPGFPLSQLTSPGGATAIDIGEQPRDVSFVIDRMLAASETSGDRFAGAIDAARIGAAGLSLGGLTSLLVGYHATLRDDRVKVVATMAPFAGVLGDGFYDTRVAPLLVLFGDTDAILSYEANGRAAFGRANAPVNLYTLSKATHTGFASIATSFESDDNVDAIGCSQLVSGGGESVDFVVALGGAADGIVASAANDAFCPSPLPYAMRPSRQHAIEIAAVTSFLDAYLAGDPVVRGRACDYHERVLSRDRDVRFERR